MPRVPGNLPPAPRGPRCLVACRRQEAQALRTSPLYAPVAHPRCSRPHFKAKGEERGRGKQYSISRSRRGVSITVHGSGMAGKGQSYAVATSLVAAAKTCPCTGAGWVCTPALPCPQHARTPLRTPLLHLSHSPHPCWCACGRGNNDLPLSAERCRLEHGERPRKTPSDAHHHPCSPSSLPRSNSVHLTRRAHQQGRVQP